MVASATQAVVVASASQTLLLAVAVAVGRIRRPLLLPLVVVGVRRPRLLLAGRLPRRCRLP